MSLGKRFTLFKHWVDFLVRSSGAPICYRDCAQQNINVYRVVGRRLQQGNVVRWARGETQGRDWGTQRGTGDSVCLDEPSLPCQTFSRVRSRAAYFGQRIAVHSHDASFAEKSCAVICTSNFRYRIVCGEMLWTLSPLFSLSAHGGIGFRPRAFLFLRWRQQELFVRDAQRAEHQQSIAFSTLRRVDEFETIMILWCGCDGVVFWCHIAWRRKMAPIVEPFFVAMQSDIKKRHHRFSLGETVQNWMASKIVVTQKCCHLAP